MKTELTDIPKAKFTVGDSVRVRCEEAGCAPYFDAVVSRVVLHNGRVEYGVESEEYGSVGDYSEDWLTGIAQPDRYALSLEVEALTTTQEPEVKTFTPANRAPLGRRVHDYQEQMFAEV